MGFGASGGGGSLPTDPSFTTVTTTGAVSAGGQVSSVATIGLLTSHVTTDATNKTGIVAGRHYTNANRPVGGLAVIALNGSNIVHVGGGDSNVNAATTVSVITGATSNTATGSSRAAWTSTGERIDYGIASTPSGSSGNSTWWTNTSGSPFCRVGTGRIIDIGALGLTATSVQTGNYTAAAGDRVLVNPSGITGDITITLPASIAAGQAVEVVLTANAPNAFCVLIGRNGNTVNGLTDTANLAMSRVGQRLFVVGQASGAASAILETPPQPAQAIKINSSIGGYYTVANHSSINLTGDVSVGCWFKTTTTSERYIYGGLNQSTPSQGFAISINTGLPRFWDGAAWRATAINETFNDDSWHLFVATYAAGSPNGTVNLYVDGYLVETITSAASALVSNTTPKAIGAAANATSQWDGSLQHLFIVASALSQDNVTTLWNRGRGLISWPLSTKPAAWWKMDEGGASSTLADSSGNSNTATKAGTPGVTFSTTGHIALCH